MTFAEKIQKLRKERGLSQDQLAAALGVSRQSVSKWELGDDMPRVDKILLLSDFFGVSTDYLLHDDWEAPPRRHPSNEKSDKEFDHARAKTGTLSQDRFKQKRIRFIFVVLLAVVCLFLFYTFFHWPGILILTMAVVLDILPVCAVAGLLYLALKAALKRHLKESRE